MKKCVVIIPALNEEKTIADVLDAVPKTLFDDTVLLETLVVNDGSDDRTSEIAGRHGASVLNHKEPQGVGSAFWGGYVKPCGKKRILQ